MSRNKPWLKMWTEWLNDPKMDNLTLAEQGAWWRLVTLAHECDAEGALVKGSGNHLTLKEMTKTLKITDPDEVRAFNSMVDKMKQEESLHWENEVLVVTNYTKRQALTPSELPDAVIQRQRLRRQKLLENYGIKDRDLPREMKRLIIKRDECRCKICGKQGLLPSPEAFIVIDPEDNTPFEIDHIIPRTQGGSDGADNLRLTCRKCNRARGNVTNNTVTRANTEKTLPQTPTTNTINKE